MQSNPCAWPWAINSQGCLNDIRSGVKNLTLAEFLDQPGGMAYKVSLVECETTSPYG